MGKKIDWNSYIGKKNRFDVKICDWEEQKEKHTRDDKVVCICPECGRYFVASSIRQVINEDKNQIHGCVDCGHKRAAAKRVNDYSQYFNKPNKHGVVPTKWTEDKPTHNVHDKVYYICPDCREEKISSLSNIIYENNTQIKSCRQCGDKHAGQIRMDKNKIEPGTMCGFGEVLYPGIPIIDSNGHRHSTTVLRCTLNGCGNIYTARNEYLKCGDTKSCGCLHSWLEALTAKYLTLNEIHFTHGLSFPAILTDNGNPVEFDFQIEDEHNNHVAFIECQGEQHYDDSHGDFGRQQREETDIKKKNYCKEHNLKLYEIRFDDDVEQRVNEILTELKLI